MSEFLNSNVSIFYVIFAALSILQVVVAIGVGIALLRFKRESRAVHHEVFGMLKKIEGLTASRRDQILKEYDKMLETLGQRLPSTIAAQARSSIFETESKILSRLAELEPNLRRDDASFKKMDELISSMERLETTIITSASTAVEQILVESRTAIAEAEKRDSHDFSTF